jgi:DNA (cytosine-5)-methyltransferase 1
VAPRWSLSLVRAIDVETLSIDPRWKVVRVWKSALTRDMDACVRRISRASGGGVGVRPRAIELFSGAGGLALGTARAGFEHVLLVERDHDACDTLRANLPTWPIEERDTRSIDFRPYEDKIQLLAAGAPCQPFSLGGKHRAHADERDMFPEVFRVVRATRPEVVVIENVKGLLRTGFREYFDYILRQLASPMMVRGDETWRQHKRRLPLAHADHDLGYEVRYQLVNCADYGVPQTRQRVFFVAFRSDLGTTWRPLPATHSQLALARAKWVTGEYWRSHEMRAPSLPCGYRAPIAADEFPFTKPWRTVRDALRGLPKPLPGREYPGILNHVGNPGARSYEGHTGSPYDLPAKTLKAGDHGCPGGENMLRLDNGRVRYFTVREAARIQTFDDTYRFLGAWSECLRQLGNAVPIEMGRLIVEAAWRLRVSAESAAPVTATTAPQIAPPKRPALLPSETRTKKP